MKKIVIFGVLSFVLLFNSNSQTKDKLGLTVGTKYVFTSDK